MRTLNCLLLFFILILIQSCYRMRASKGGGQVKGTPQRTINANDIAVLKGYKIEAVTSGLNFPTAAAFDDAGNLYVIEAGYAYGEVWDVPKLLRVEADGSTTLIAKGTRNGPWTGITWYDGAFYVAEGGEMESGKILKITKDGTTTSLLSELPSMGDHHTNGPIVKDGYVYFGVGTATNSAVVGEDNANYGWLLRKKDFHDVPCKDVVLSGQNYTSRNPLTDDPNDTATTGAYLPFATPSASGQVVQGVIPCTGAIMRVAVTGGKPELVAWGLRNPYGLAIAPDGNIFITENAFDDRGSRPVWGAGDVLWRLQPDMWYGWPDFSGGKPIWDDEEFKAPGKDRVKPVLQKLPNTPPKPVAVFGVHSSSNGIDFSTTDAFGYKGEAFVAQFGDMATAVGKVEYPVGYKIVRVNVNNGVIRDFAVNKGKRNGPATWLKKGGFERPVSVKFNPAGNALYVVDFGVMQVDGDHSKPQTNTGMIWKITKQ